MENRKKQAAHRKNQDKLKDLIEEDEHYEAYPQGQHQQAAEDIDKNKLITEYATAYRQEKTKIDQTKKQMIGNLFDSMIQTDAPKQTTNEQDYDEELIAMVTQNQRKVETAAADGSLSKRRKAELAMLQQQQAQEERRAAAVKMPTKPVEKQVSSLKKPTEQGVQAAVNVPELQFERTKITRVQDLSQMVNMYLIEIYPVDDDLFLFGVLQNGDRITIHLQQMDRNIYFILKTDELNDAKSEIDRRLKTAGISNPKGEFVTRTYVFEVEGIPRKELTCYRVRYPFSLKLKDAPKPDWQGTTYKYVIGTTYTPLELFVIKNRIKGPGWVTIKREHLQTKSKGEKVWTGLCPNLYQALKVDINQDKGEGDIPELRVMSISVKFIRPCEISKKKLFANVKDPKDNVIFTIATQYCKAYNIESKPKKPQLISTVYYLTSLGKYTDNTSSRKIGCSDEDQMLSRFLADLSALDPDIIVCHDSCTILDALISRLERLKNNQVSKLGRLVASKMLPKNMNQKIHAVLAGRLLVDTFSHAKDVMRSVDYSLANMSKIIPGGKELESVQKQKVKKELEEGRASRLINHTLQQAECTFNLMNHLQIVQLTKQLTNICGNVWRRSLDNARAERNQFLIMHECQRLDLLIPDKFSKYHQQQEQNEEAPEKKKKKYQGGLVLDPIKGLHTQYILLLDFNSLYPSIIREFNVCFSKMERPATPLSFYYGKGKKPDNQQQDDKPIQTLPKTECVQSKWGFLPQLIDRIVKRRVFFKKMMKTATPEKVIVFDITQKAYKLVSNSIYGCLGFSQSRFYAKHLASFITRKGRQALGRAKEIVTKSGVDVIYGDTDSLMLKPIENPQSSEITKIEELQKLAKKLKKDINNEYTKLEIDVDGVFKPLLLISKKRYVSMKLTNYDQVLAKKVQPVFAIEYKGIDLVKRDGCQISKRASTAVLNILMNNNGSVDVAASQIYKYIDQLQQTLQTVQAKKDYRDFMLAKTLNKLPSEYKHGAERMPHVKVAKDLVAAGEKAESLVNHAIYYIIVESHAGAHLAEKAIDIKKFLASQETQTPYKIDINHYKAFEIIPPMLRLFESVSQINKNFLYETFKIEEKDRRRIENENRDENQVQEQTPAPLVVDRGDLTKPLNSSFLHIQCPGCPRTYEFVKEGVFTIACSNETCSYNKPLKLMAVVNNMIQTYLYDKMEQFYKSQYKCSQCNKRWTMARMCCGATPHRMGSSSQMHSTIYRLLRVLTNTQKKHMAMIPKKAQEIESIKVLIDNTLSDSMFQSIGTDFMNLLKI